MRPLAFLVFLLDDLRDDLRFDFLEDEGRNRPPEFRFTILWYGWRKYAVSHREMPNAFGSSSTNVLVNVGKAAVAGWTTVGIFVVLAILVVVGYSWFGSASACPTKIHRKEDGSLVLHPGGREFPDMNAFQQWWAASGSVSKCPLPILSGGRETRVMEENARSVYKEWASTSAQTPIYKVDDYEFSRVFGYEKDGRMVEPRDNYNMILGQRQFDWADRPLTSDERKDKYMGLKEGFTADGTLTSTLEAVARHGEKSHHPRSETSHHSKSETRHHPKSEDAECKRSREDKEVAHMITKAYADDPDWEPVVTKVGANHWEVNELKPRIRSHSRAHQSSRSTNEEQIVNTDDDSVDIRFKYREKNIVESAIDPYFVSDGNLPFESERQKRDPFYGPVPGLERPFAPTFDHAKWY